MSFFPLLFLKSTNLPQFTRLQIFASGGISVSSVVLSREKVVENTSLTIIGWGVTEVPNPLTSNASDVLREAKTRVISVSEAAQQLNLSISDFHKDTISILADGNTSACFVILLNCLC
jgi:hypothetical protein